MRISALNPRSSAANRGLRLVKAIAFDGYGTLFDFTEPDFIAAFAEICAAQGLDSNAADDFLTAALERNNLRFDTVVTSEQAGAIKPDPAIFHYLTARLGLQPPHVLYVRDNSLPDVLDPPHP